MGIAKGKYDVELVKRTKELIQSYKGTYNLTLLMNALLSLIVLPSEQNKNRKLKFFNEDINNIPEVAFVLNSPNFYFDPQGRKTDLKNLLRRIRNGIAHQKIETITKDKKWTGVIIQDIEPNSQNVGLNVCLTTKQLRDLALFIATKYLEETS